MNRVEIANSHHRVRLECDGVGNTVVKLAVALWHETYVDDPGPEPDSNWRLYPVPAEDADTGE